MEQKTQLGIVNADSAPACFLQLTVEQASHLFFLCFLSHKELESVLKSSRKRKRRERERERERDLESSRKRKKEWVYVCGGEKTRKKKKKKKHMDEIERKNNIKNKK